MELEADGLEAASLLQEQELVDVGAVARGRGEVDAQAARLGLRDLVLHGVHAHDDQVGLDEDLGEVVLERRLLG